MKRSLFITIVVLLMAALFVSCNADKSLEDQLGMVSISGPSRSVDSTSENTVSVEGLYWYYTAVKADASMFTTGATGTTKTAVKTGKGLADASLGKFSTGAWTFCFYGYEAEYDATNANQKPVFSQTGVSVTVAKNTNTSLELTLIKGEGYSKTAKIAINGVTWYYKNAGTGKALTLSIYDGDATDALTVLKAETDDGTATFSTSTATEFALEEGEHTLRFEVTYDANENQLVGSTPYSIVVAGGYRYTITNLSDTSAGIETIDEDGAIVISGQYDVETGAATASGSIPAATSTENKIVADIAPVSEVSATVSPTTTVSFPAGALTAGDQYTLDVETTPIESVPTSITIAEGEAFVAGINLTLNNGAIKTFNGEEVTIVTYIAKGLDKTKLAVCYNGTGDQPELVDYDPATGEIEFTTNHFSEFYVKTTEEIVAVIDNYIYGSLEAAIAAVPANTETTIVVLEDVVIVGNAGVTIPVGKAIILDLNGHTVKNAVNQDKASQVIQNNGKLTIKDSTDTAKDGTGTGLLKNGVEEGTNPGEWWSTPQYNYATNVITNCGTLTIESGKIEQTAAGSICYAIDNNSTSRNATTIINGGLITDDCGTAMRMFCNSTTYENNLEIHGGSVIATGYCAFWVHLPGSNASSMKKASLTIDGGTIAGATSAFYDYSYGDGWDNVSYSITGGNFIGMIEVEKPDYRFISGGSFDDPSAFDYLVDGANIKLLDNITVEDETIAFTNNVTVDLNQKALNLVRTASGPKSISVKDCAVEFKNGTINATLANDDTCVIYGLANSKITLSNVDIIARAHTYAVALLDGPAELVINGGHYVGMIGTLGHKRNATVTINAGTFDNGCYFPAHGTYTINGGTFNDLVEIKSGTLTINDGSFKCGTEGQAQYVAYENGNAIHNAALGAVAYNGAMDGNSYGPTPVVNINGGTFNGSICKARVSADIDYPTFNIASGLNLEIADLGVAN